MIEDEPRSPLDLQPGPERRAWMHTMKMRIGRDDFSDSEWADIAAEAPGMAEALRAMLTRPQVDSLGDPWLCPGVAEQRRQV